MPLFFSIIGYFIVYIAALPLIHTVSALSSLVLSEQVSDGTEKQLTSIFDTPVNNADAATVNLSDIEWPSIGDHYGNISCDRIGLDAPLYFGDTTTILKHGVGQYNGSHIPGDAGPILLAAHNTTFFLPLETVEEGDIILIQTSYGNYKYQVSGTRVANKNDKTAYDLSQNKEQLIMYTCYPFNMLGTLENRFFVYADKISGPVIDKSK